MGFAPFGQLLHQPTNQTGVSRIVSHGILPSGGTVFVNQNSVDQFDRRAIGNNSDVDHLLQLVNGQRDKGWRTSADQFLEQDLPHGDSSSIGDGEFPSTTLISHHIHDAILKPEWNPAEYSINTSAA